MDIQVGGENTLIVYFDPTCRRTCHSQVLALDARLRKTQPVWLLDTIVSYESLTLIFDWRRADFYVVSKGLKTLWKGREAEVEGAPKRVTLPVLYGYPTHNDLQRIARHHALDVEEVIKIHSSSTYRAYAIGFAPGFCFLGEVDARIATPRLETPRQRVPKGAVAIAGAQTAVYPSVSPGGWNLIGLCPMTLFDLSREPVMPFEIGDVVTFEAIDKPTFEDMGGQLD